MNYRYRYRYCMGVRKAMLDGPTGTVTVRYVYCSTTTRNMEESPYQFIGLDGLEYTVCRSEAVSLFAKRC